MNEEQHQDISQSEKIETLARMVRLTWKTLGSLLLFLILILIIIGSQEALFVMNIIFWFVVAGLVLTRYIDIKVFHGKTNDDQPATMKNWLSYSVGLIMMSGLFWVLSQALRNRLH